MQNKEFFIQFDGQDLLKYAFSLNNSYSFLPYTRNGFIYSMKGMKIPKVKLTEILQYAEYGLKSSLLKNEIDSLYIVPSNGFRKIQFILNNKIIHQTHKFNIYGDAHKFSFHFFITKEAFINAVFFKQPITSNTELKKLLFNMGIPAIFHKYIIPTSHQSYSYIHPLSKSDVLRIKMSL